MRRILILFCTAAVLYLSTSYWYLPNSPYSHYALQNISSTFLHSIGANNKVVRRISKGYENTKYWFLSRAELNKRLRKMETLESDLQQAKLEVNVNQKIIAQLRPLTNFNFPKQLHKVSVRVYGCPIGFYDAQIITSNIEAATIKKDDVAISEKGLVGRVVETSNTILRVMLITDITSRVPVKILETGENAIAIGNGSSTMSLEYLQSKETLRNNFKRPPAVGDVLVTSGVGGIFPPDIMVGNITSIKDELITVKPFVTFQTLDVVCILYDPLVL